MTSRPVGQEGHCFLVVDNIPCYLMFRPTNFQNHNPSRVLPVEMLLQTTLCRFQNLQQ